ALLACAKAYQRHLDAAPPKLNTCEDFVYNRFYDIERWMDRTNACAHDPLCKANITLDPTDGIAGKVLSGSDLEPSKRADLRKFFEGFITQPTGVDCTAKMTTDNLR